MNTAEIGGAIIALVELFKRLDARFPTLPQISGEGTILLCVVLGGLAGFFQLAGLNVASGVVLGLTASGVHQVAQAAGGK